MRVPINRSLELLLGGIFVATAIFLHLKLMGRAVMGLNAGLIIAYILWRSGGYDQNPMPNETGSLYLIGIAVQGLHFCEEYVAGFHVELPGLFGYRWPDQLFVVFNLVWLFCFVLSAWGVLHHVRLAYLVVWFFAIAGAVGNGIAHVALSLRQGGYFPGLITAPVHFVVGILLIKELVKARKAKGVN